MGIELVHVGFNNLVTANRIVAIVSPNSTLIKRTMQEAKSKGLLIDMTHGRKTRSVIFTDSGHIFVTARAPEIIAGRLYASRGDVVLRPEQSDEKGEP